MGRRCQHSYVSSYKTDLTFISPPGVTIKKINCYKTCKPLEPQVQWDWTDRKTTTDKHKCVSEIYKQSMTVEWYNL